jgi:hypothetical protein
MRRFVSWAAVVATVLGLAATTARAAVRVEQDEVIFTVRAPGAREVHLVGDFNQWNPTVERMSADGDRFEIGLFLVAGTYHYKFVVDGEWIVDPDNPGRARDPGSPLRIIERGDGLVLSTEVVSGEDGPRGAHAGARYIGALRADGSDTDVNQRVDLTVSGRYDRLDVRAVVATDDSSWTWSPARIDAFFDRGRARVGLGSVTVAGLENDSSWVSSDPVPLVGRAGVYGYDAGFRRHGVSAEAVASRAALRAFWADATTRAPSTGAAVPAGDLSGWAGGTGTDTTVYAFEDTYDGSDVLVVDLALSLGKAGAGFARRGEAGVNPGLVASLSRSGADISGEVAATAEQRDVNTVWLRHDDVFGLRARGAWGWGGIEAVATGSGAYTGDLAGGVDAALATADADGAVPLLETQRAVVELAGGDVLRGARVAWEYTGFDFEGAAGAASATIHRATVEATARWRGWTLALRDAYTDPDYGRAPDAFTIDGTAFNPWLSVWDDFDVEDIAGLVPGTYNVARLSARHDSTAVSGGATLALATEGLADDLVHASLRADVRWRVRGPWSVSMDARGAWYDEKRYGDGGSFASAWLEGAYARGPFLVRAGWGFDPWVFDPVIGDYAGIGRTEYLRAVVADGVRRSGAAGTAAALVSRERALEDAGVFKIECVIDLP